MKTWNRKRIIKGIKVLLILLFLMSLDINAFPQPGPPPLHGQNGDQGAGGSAPIGGGLIFFLLGSVLYGIKKIRGKRKVDRER